MSAQTAIATHAFARDGYLVVRGLCPEALRARLLDIVRQHLSPLLGPVEFEADVGYPGSPANRSVEGGDTPRRLLNAFTRDAAFREWSIGHEVGDQLRAMLGEELGRTLDAADVLVSQCHHNCVMTKYPGHSSATLWHQDIRYWSFDRPELISVWLALDEENAGNGSLNVIPGSHRLALDRGRLDGALFLRTDLPENRKLIDAAVPVVLEPGDVLFFHCRLFHAAGMNLTDRVKHSVVFTYHAADNQPIPETRSASLPSIPLQL
ncbi:MAG: phytanoyl-CoA dioxygenase family protein [Pseudomonadales bacterium]|jgi:phytanoyl-CoA hydroxylase